MILSIFILSCCGLAVCMYGLWIEKKIAKDIQYKASCDLSEQISCSKVFKSNYAKLFGFSNVYKGFILYTALAVCAYMGYIQLILPIAIASAIISVWLAYILFAQLQTICIVCLTVYLINGIILITALYEYL